MTSTQPPIVRIDGTRISDWASFHQVFKDAFGYPDFYGANLDAWIDCMTCVDDVDAGMTDVHVEPGGVLTLLVEEADGLATRCPEIYAALVECTAFVNWRRIEQGEPSVLALAFYK